MPYITKTPSDELNEPHKVTNVIFCCHDWCYTRYRFPALTRAWIDKIMAIAIHTEQPLFARKSVLCFYVSLNNTWLLQQSFSWSSNCRECDMLFSWSTEKATWKAGHIQLYPKKLNAYGKLQSKKHLNV